MRPGKTLVDNGLGCYLMKGKEGRSKAVGGKTVEGSWSCVIRIQGSSWLFQTDRKEWRGV